GVRSARQGQVQHSVAALAVDIEVDGVLVEGHSNIVQAQGPSVEGCSKAVEHTPLRFRGRTLNG
ncbi:MAG: hypothetical protein C4332_10850, partial [Meiothermus sp.]